MTTKWTRFYDMSSGGSEKEPFAVIYIEAQKSEAERIFTNRFGHDSGNVTCECCGEDYSVREIDNLAEQMKLDGGTRLVIRCDEITPQERADPWA